MSIKVMISQPMKGKTNDQIRQERKEVVSYLESNGYEIIDTVIEEQPPEGIDEPIYYLAKSIEFIGKVDTVYFMTGWENARGCKIENEVCKYYNKQTMYQEQSIDEDEQLFTILTK